MLPDEALKQLKGFTEFVKRSPQMLHSPELAFFKEFIESFGGKIPAAATSQKSEGGKPEDKTAEPEVAEEAVGEASEEESDVELDNTGVIDEPDEVPDADIPTNLTAEVSEEVVDKANEKKREAVEAFGEGYFQRAIELYTEAIKLNPGLALLYAKRAQCYLKMKKPNACIQDCTIALSLNPDNAAAYKFRGRAHRLLGHWLDAAKDLRSACKIDCDEEADEWLKEVTPNARKLEEHQRKYERKRIEKEEKERLEKVKKAREAHAKASASAGATGRDHGTQAPGSGGGGGGSGFDQMFSDPDLIEALNDPEVAAAFQDITTNPSNMFKYTGNPKVMNIINKMMQKMGQGGFKFPGAGGFPGGGSFPGAGGFPFGGGATGGTGATTGDMGPD